MRLPGGLRSGGCLIGLLSLLWRLQLCSAAAVAEPALAPLACLQPPLPSKHTITHLAYVGVLVVEKQHLGIGPPDSAWMAGRWATSFCALTGSKPSAAGISWMLQGGRATGVGRPRRLCAQPGTLAAGAVLAVAIHRPRPTLPLDPSQSTARPCPPAEALPQAELL
jgi:hypothetical protein